MRRRALWSWGLLLLGVAIAGTALWLHVGRASNEPSTSGDVTGQETTPTQESTAAYLPLVAKSDTATPSSLPDTPVVTLTATPSPPPKLPQEPYYGMHFVPEDDLKAVGALGVGVVLMSFPHDGTPEDWLAYLNKARSEGIQVIAWLWPQGWTLTDGEWSIDAQAEQFLRTVVGHSALLAVYALHEPYWNGCWGCGYTTAEQQELYSAIKAIADVPIHSAVDSMSAWTAYGEETAFADGICDYCETWYHPFREDGTYERETVITHLTADLAVAKDRAPDSKIVWSMQSFAQEGVFRMPTAEEMRDLAELVYSTDVSGALWYPWAFGELYSDYLSRHPELHPVVQEIYEEVVRSPR